MKPLPKWSMILVTAASLTLYLGLAVWGWGGWTAFMANPARASSVVAMVVVWLVPIVKPFLQLP